MEQPKKLSMSSTLAGLICILVAGVGFGAGLEMKDATGGPWDHLLYLFGRIILPGVIMFLGLWLVLTANTRVRA